MGQVFEKYEVVLYEPITAGDKEFPEILKSLERFGCAVNIQRSKSYLGAEVYTLFAPEGLKERMCKFAPDEYIQTSLSILKPRRAIMETLPDKWTKKRMLKIVKEYKKAFSFSEIRGGLAI